MFLKIGFIILMTLRLAAAGSSDPVDDDKVTRELIADGYTYEQSNVADLLGMIGAGKSWDSHDARMPYHNLRNFYPFSERTQNLILDFVLNPALDVKKIDFEALLMGFADHPLRTQQTMLKAEHVLESPWVESHGILHVARGILKTQSNHPRALYRLKEIAESANSKALQILAAFDLVSTSEAPFARSRLLELARVPESAETFAWFIPAYADEASDELVNEVLKHLEEPRRKMLFRRISKASKCGPAINKTETLN